MVSLNSATDQDFFRSLADLYGPELADAMLLCRPLPLVPELQLYLLNDNYPRQRLGRQAYESLMARPPYWAFCWGGGQAMARYLLDHPAAVAGLAVVDFGAGSAVAAIAALKAGAVSGLAVDIDPVSLQAARANARINRVNLAVGETCGPDAADLLLAADICYEESGMAQVQKHLRNGGRLLVSDSRIEQLSQKLPGVSQVAEYSVKTFPDLEEHKCFDNVRLYSNFL